MASQTVELAASAARTTTGNGSGFTGVGGGAPAFAEASSIRALLNVTAASGTTPSLTVVLEDSLDGGTTWTQVATFTAKTAAGSEAVGVNVPFGPLLRAKWTISGTTPSFTFAVNAFVKE